MRLYEEQCYLIESEQHIVKERTVQNYFFLSIPFVLPVSQGEGCVYLEHLGSQWQENKTFDNT